MNEEQDFRIIKKYPNRRIYDMEESRYITLTEVKKLIIDNVDFKVVDAHSKKDITRSILLQIIIDQESEKDPLFTNENLQRFIRYYGGNQNQHFANFMNQSLAFFQQQQEHFQSRMNEMLDQNPLNFWSSVGQQNMQMWQKMQQDWFSSLTKQDDKKGED
ncbi:MAG: polyhydroxyalkanoate synthesis repressor PhaR [Gammaproteobacteria bacterium]|nr:polyhydroxyalkanoate synthesis repressor PhaR [Gammaproteobacteria bacterium]MCY4219062.1 polyhydroxyalkanoate synthesis repressor PhaR [Gammaproteobacteria bacterium]MCY4274930.1 polyhydroxyalkanoate synthesis repressor PhaR [Gammaproteobacteria bacterium]